LPGVGSTRRPKDLLIALRTRRDYSASEIALLDSSCVEDNADMTPSENLPGVSAMSAYVPRLRVPLKSWCDWTQSPWDKVESVVGRSFRVVAQHENVYTMAANAVLRLIRNNDIDPQRIGFLALGTESSTDNAVGAVIVRGMVDRALDQLGLPRLSRQLEVPEFKHACLGGIYALKGALRYVVGDGRGRQAIVVSSDVAEYERGSSGEQTQGAGSIAMLVDAQPRLYSVDLASSGCASDYRGPDFRKPFARHFTEGYAPRTHRLNDFPVFSGKYSTFSYLDETVLAVEAMLERLGVSAGQYYQSVKALFFHRPYHLMPIQAMSFLYVRGLARGDHHQGTLRELCAEAGVSVDDVLRETTSRPDLFGQFSADGVPSNPYVATSAVASALRRHADFVNLLAQKMSLGSDAVKDVGNLYCAALPAWIAAGFEEAFNSRFALESSPMVAVGYGSGDAAEALPLHPVPGWQEAASRIGFADALAGAIDLSQAQYEALHDRRDASDLSCPPKDEFAIHRVGQQYDAGFQDLGVEYYEFVH
jgi:hydroxymethylglutaryl-CoA synthase